jgi:hypothetical protein
MAQDLDQQVPVAEANVLILGDKDLAPLRSTIAPCRPQAIQCANSAAG